MLKIQKPRGRKARSRMAEHQVIDIVFGMRYGGMKGEPPRLPTIEGELTRRPGTVDGYRRMKGRLVKVKADCGVTEACRLAELHFELKTEKRLWWDVSVHPETGEREERVRPPLIGRRKNDGVTQEGAATKKWLQRALRDENELYAKRKFDWEQMEWNWQKAQLAERRKKKH